jgi:carboxyl-terminal processing protease
LGIRRENAIPFIFERQGAQIVSFMKRIGLNCGEAVIVVMNRYKKHLVSAVIGAGLGWLAIIAGCTSKPVLPEPASSASLLPAPAASPSLILRPGPNDARIAYVTARLLEEFHYSLTVVDKDVSARFFDAYLDGLDPRHENFLQSDLAEFAPYRTNLDTCIIGTNAIANLAPAYAIYQRYLERIRQHADYVNVLLSQNKFKFNTGEHILLDRREAPFPRDLDEARQLWSLRLRFEYLQEKLTRETSPTNSNVVLPLSKTAATDISETLARHYRWNLHKATNWNNTDVLQAYLDALAHAYDPHSDYLNPEHAQDFSISMSLALFGIGAQLTEDDGYCTINSLVRGGPAEKSKQLHEKDRIVAVAQGSQPFVDVVEMELGRVVQLIRGPKGSQVRLTVSPIEDRAARRVVTLVRDEIKLEDQEAKAQLIEFTDSRGATNRIGIIDLPSFYATIDLPGNTDHSAAKSTTADVASLIKKLKAEKVSGLILDLRNNPGGSLEEAVRFTGLFIKDGPVVLARSPDGAISVNSDTDDAVLYDGPLVVIVNRFSASAAEIAAAALQDYGRALVVGDISTFGKGTVQNLNPLRPFVWPATPSATNDPGTVKITIRKFYRVSGASTQLRGVMPDIVLPDIWNYSTQVGESALKNPLPWDVIAPTNYTKLDLVQPYLADLRLRSATRLATNRDFTYIRQDIDEYLKKQSDKTASLNERERLEERREAEARQKEREAERAARKATEGKVYELTVKRAALPGLPAPLGETNLVTAAQSSAEADPAPGDDEKTAASPPSKSPPVDPMLDEARRILADYISLLSANRVLVAD